VPVKVDKELPLMNRTFTPPLVRKWRILFGDSTYFPRLEVEVTSEISRTSWILFTNHQYK